VFIQGGGAVDNDVELLEVQSLQERLRTLEQLNRALQEADRRKDQFLAVLSHELRNLLAPIGYAVNLMQISSADESVVCECCEVADRQLQQMVRLVDDLLDVSRIACGKMELRRERVDLATVINLAQEISRPGMEERGQTLKVRFNARPVLPDADSHRLTQVIANLLNNASKYSHQSGVIQLIIEQDRGCAVVRVKDDGVGIPASELTRVFEMFSQIRSAEGGSAGGVGIGLALAKGIVERHSGSITARSEGAGRGCEFIIRLPCLSDEPSGAEGDTSHC
jgi:signal transduction histidine kinase